MSYSVGALTKFFQEKIVGKSASSLKKDVDEKLPKKRKRSSIKKENLDESKVSLADEATAFFNEENSPISKKKRRKSSKKSQEVAEPKSSPTASDDSDVDVDEGDGVPDESTVERVADELMKSFGQGDAEVEEDKKVKDEPVEGGEIDPTTGEKKKLTREIPDEEKRRTIFVGNLPPEIKERALRSIFIEFGQIVTVRLRQAIPEAEKAHLTKKGAAITKRMDKKLHHINGYVVFKKEESAVKALEKNGTLYKVHHLRVDRSDTNTQLPKKHTVFVGNLPYTANEDDLFEHFGDCGKVQAVRMVRDRMSTQNKGIAFVSFEDSSSVSFALKLNEEKFKGRALRVTKCVNKVETKVLPERAHTFPTKAAVGKRGREFRVKPDGKKGGKGNTPKKTIVKKTKKDTKKKPRHLKKTVMG